MGGGALHVLRVQLIFRCGTVRLQGLTQTSSLHFELSASPPPYPFQSRYEVFSAEVACFRDLVSSFRFLLNESSAGCHGCC